MQRVYLRCWRRIRVRAEPTTVGTIRSPSHGVHALVLHWLLLCPELFCISSLCNKQVHGEGSMVHGHTMQKVSLQCPLSDSLKAEGYEEDEEDEEDERASDTAGATVRRARRHGGRGRGKLQSDRECIVMRKTIA